MDSKLFCPGTFAGVVPAAERADGRESQKVGSTTDSYLLLDFHVIYGFPIWQTSGLQ
jgi:hypothetical protein